jgi:hypothetical protein
LAAGGGGPTHEFMPKRLKGLRMGWRGKCRANNNNQNKTAK